MTNKYQREIKPGVFVDVYDVLQAFNVTNPALQHLVKKALAVGQRGHKDVAEDLQDIVDSAIRAQELEPPATATSGTSGAGCQHVWYCETAYGVPTSPYVCRKCGVAK